MSQMPAQPFAAAAPAVPVAVPTAPEMLLPQYRIRRKVFKLFGGKFTFFDMGGNPVMVSKQKAFKLKEDIRIYSAPRPDVELLTIKARKIIDFASAYDVFDTQQNVRVGAIRRRGFKSIIRDEWEFLDASDNVFGKLQEDSQVLALIRRFLTKLIPQSYHGFVGEAEVFRFHQHFNPFILKMTLDLGGPNAHLLDRRLALAAAVLLTAIEGRQN